MDRRCIPLLASALALAPVAAQAQSSVQITSGTSTVRQVIRYTDEEPAYARALVVEVTDPTNAAVCRGGWLENTDAQFRDVLQLLVAAKLGGLRVRIDGDPTRLFSGSSDRYCYLNLVVIL